MPVSPSEVGAKADYTFANNAIEVIDAMLLKETPNKAYYTFSGSYIDAVPWEHWGYIENEYRNAGWEVAYISSDQRDGKWFTLRKVMKD